MPYVSLIWEGEKPQRERPRSMPVEECIGKLGLRKHHHSGSEPPKIQSQNPPLDDFRDAQATAVHLRGDVAPSGWTAGWYVIPASDLPIPKARQILGEYQIRDWSDY